MAGALLFYSEFDAPTEWVDTFRTLSPSLDVRVWPDVGDPAEIAYVLAWKPPVGFFAPFANLKLVINLGAGIDSLAGRTDLPDVPVMRLSDPDMVAQMSTYVAAAVLRYARDFDRFEEDTRHKRWVYLHPRRLSEITVGIMGLGELGLPSAEALARLGLSVRGWSRSPKALDFPTMHGLDTLGAFYQDLDILVCLLPLTPDTDGLIDAATFAALPASAAFINASRGRVIDEGALAAALASGHLRGATVDAFAEEPLPADSPLRAAPNLLVTPHIASFAGPKGAAPEIIENLRRVEAGEPLLHLARLARGY